MIHRIKKSIIKGFILIGSHFEGKLNGDSDE